MANGKKIQEQQYLKYRCHLPHQTHYFLFYQSINNMPRKIVSVRGHVYALIYFIIFQGTISI